MAQSLIIENNRMMLDGKPFRILSGEMHYCRIREAYWSDRFRKVRAMGLNTVCTYVFDLERSAPAPLRTTRSRQ